MNYDALLQPVKRDGWDYLAAACEPFVVVVLIPLFLIGDGFAQTWATLRGLFPRKAW